MKYLFTILLLSFSFTSFSQFYIKEKEKKDKVKKIRQLGTNVGPLIKILTNKGDLQNNLTQGILTYKGITGRKAFRAGIRFGYSSQLFEGNEDPNSFISVGFWLGVEKQTVVSKNWQIYIGGDVDFVFTNNKFSFFEEDITFQQYSTGPLLGVQYRLAPRLILQTEASLNLSYSIFKNPNQNFFPGPIINSPADISKGFGVNFTMPDIINLVVEF